MRKRLTLAELALLIKAHKNGDRRAGAQIVNTYIGMVYRNALKYTGFADFDDLVGEGNFGLLKAIDKYNPKYKVQFTTYAMPWIDAYQKRWAKQSKSLVRHDTGNIKSVLNDYSLNMPVRSDDPEGETFLELLKSEDRSPEEEVDLHEVQRDVRAVLAKLTARQRYILDMRIMNVKPKILVDIAKNSPDGKVVTRERVRQEQLEAERRFKSIYSTYKKRYAEESETV